MLIKYSINGYKPFNNNITLDLNGNKQMRNKDYVIRYKDKEIVKSSIIYGPNNTGKSCLIESILLLKGMVLDGKLYEDSKYDFEYNLFNENKTISYNIEFNESDDIFNYSLEFSHEKGIILEKLIVNNETLFDRFAINNNEIIKQVLNILSTRPNNLTISLLPSEYEKYTKEIYHFFNNLYIINNNMRDQDLVKNIFSLSKNDFKKFNKIITSADISIKEMEFVDIFNDHPELNLLSDYYMNGVSKEMPSVISDSDGTKVFMNYIFNMINCFNNHGTLIIDEIDKSLHTLLTKSIISAFNNENNKDCQLIATTHDLQLLDCLYLFRKDQVWFTYKDEKQVYLYSLNDFKCNKDNAIRNNTIQSYLKNMFGSLPHPNIEEALYDEK